MGASVHILFLTHLLRGTNSTQPRIIHASIHMHTHMTHSFNTYTLLHIEIHLPSYHKYTITHSDR